MYMLLKEHYLASRKFSLNYIAPMVAAPSKVGRLSMLTFSLSVVLLPLKHSGSLKTWSASFPYLKQTVWRKIIEIQYMHLF
jgi:predicted NAD/FAD-binding protein